MAGSTRSWDSAMPSDRSYRFPLWMILLLLVVCVLGACGCVWKLKKRAEHAWPW